MAPSQRQALVPLWEATQTTASSDAGADAGADVVQARINKLEESKASISQRLGHYDHIWASRRQPLERDLEEVELRLSQEFRNLELARAGPREAPPGPPCLSWVDSTAFTVTCAIVVSLNLVLVVYSFRIKLPDWTNSLDEIFLLWYVLELAARFAYFRCQLFFGKCPDTALNWLDLGIILGGVVLQWLAPLFVGSEMSGQSWMLGALRVFRILRMFKLLKFVFEGDLEWVEGQWFQMFMTGIIAVNAILMALELDHPWHGWNDVEVILLCIYVFELAVSIKRQKCKFFYDSPALVWNYLDTLIVAGGIVDVCLFPMMEFLQSAMGQGSTADNSAAHNIMKLLRLMRLLRILRLVKLMRAIKPLYRLLNGVVDSLKAMQWVMVLSLVVLYGMAIFWTTVVGEGLIFGGKNKIKSTAVNDAFGTVPRSLFSLFRMMNGDTDFAEEVFSVGWGQVIYVLFMVSASWAILAILTSVVSDNMISASQKTLEEDENAEQAREDEAQAVSLNLIFNQYDVDQTGLIMEKDWRMIMDNPDDCLELEEATHCTKADLQDAFRDLSVVSNGEWATRTPESSRGLSPLSMCPQSTVNYSGERALHYKKFIEFMRDKDKPANKQLLMKLLARIEHLEAQLRPVLNPN